jgi:prephenate dehydrogenase
MTIGIYGLGRFGSFWGGVLAEYHTVLGWTRIPGREIPSRIRPAAEEEVLGCDVLMFCVSISSFREVLRRTADGISKETLVMDTCSVKMMPVRWMLELLPEDTKILGSHPMFGPDSGAAGISGLPMVLCPVRLAEQELIFWTKEFRRLGLDVLRMSAEEHDHQAAYSQGITHFIGRVVKDLDLERYPISTLGFQKMLEVAEQTCNDPFQLFLDLQRYNPYTGEMRDRLYASLKKMLDILDTGVTPL